jgi:hypothetical protein
MYAVRNSLWMTTMLTAAAMLAPLTAPASESYPKDAPPPNQIEATPAPQLGNVWVAGHWEWDGKAYWWRRGAWREQRSGVHWVADRWEQVGDEWHRTPGHWQR